MTIANKVALITGGCKGIGFECAKALLNSGLRGVMLIDVDEASGKKAVETLGTEKATFYKCDTSCFKHLEVGFQKTIEKYKNLDIVVNNAAIFLEDNWPKCIDVNLKGYIQGTYLAMRKYMSNHLTCEEGYVVNMASVFGLEPLYSTPAFTATKYGLIGFTRAVGSQFYYDLSNVKVFALCPGVTCTKMASDSNFRLLEEIECLPTQAPACVGKALVDLLMVNPENGSCWVAEGGEMIYQIKFPNRKCLKA